jgi:hypothetical protein
MSAKSGERFVLPKRVQMGASQIVALWRQKTNFVDLRFAGEEELMFSPTPNKTWSYPHKALPDFLIDLQN